MRHWISVTATIWRRFSTTVRRRLTIPGLVASIVLGSIPAASPALGCSGTALFGEESEPPSEAVIFTGTAVKVDDPRLPFDPIMSSGDLTSAIKHQRQAVQIDPGSGAMKRQLEFFEREQASKKKDSSAP